MSQIFVRSLFDGFEVQGVGRAGKGKEMRILPENVLAFRALGHLQILVGLY